MNGGTIILHLELPKVAKVTVWDAGKDKPRGRFSIQKQMVSKSGRFRVTYCYSDARAQALSTARNWFGNRARKEVAS